MANTLPDIHASESSKTHSGRRRTYMDGVEFWGRADDALQLVGWTGPHRASPHDLRRLQAIPPRQSRNGGLETIHRPGSRLALLSPSPYPLPLALKYGTSFFFSLAHKRNCTVLSVQHPVPRMYLHVCE